MDFVRCYEITDLASITGGVSVVKDTLHEGSVLRKQMGIR